MSGHNKMTAKSTPQSCPRPVPGAATGTLSPVAVDAWRASLELGYTVTGGRTVPRHRRHSGPLRVLRYAQGESGSLEHVIVHPPGGIAGGDRLHLDIALDAGAEVLLTTVGATKWYDGFGRGAGQRLEAQVAAGGRLAWLPLENIFYAGADVAIDSRFLLTSDATLFYADVLCFGRPASAQPFDAGRLRQRTEVVRDGRLIWCEHLGLDAASGILDTPAGLAGHTVTATVAWAGPAVPAPLHDAVRALTVRGSAACAQLPDIWLGRFLGDSAEDAHHWVRELRAMLHEHTHGRAARTPRIWFT